MPNFKIKKSSINDWWVHDDITGIKVHGSDCGFDVDVHQGAFTQKNNIGEYNSQFKLQASPISPIPPTVRTGKKEPWQ